MRAKPMSQENGCDSSSQGFGVHVAVGSMLAAPLLIIRYAVLASVYSRVLLPCPSVLIVMVIVIVIVVVTNRNVLMFCTTAV